MRISVVVPIYNADKYLVRCIESIVDQTFKDLEIILVNDGSIDHSLRICNDYSFRDKRIKILDQTNAGPANARNNGIKIATGDYIAFIDSDDEIKPDFFEKLASSAENFKADVICSDIIIDNENNQRRVINTTLPKNRILSPVDIKKKVLQNYYGGILDNIPSMCNKLYNLNFLKESNMLIDESRVRAEDYWFNFIVLSKANSFIAIDYAGYIYKIANTGSVMKSFRENQFDGFLKTREELLARNVVLKLIIKQKKWDTEFVENTNEFILMAIKNNRLDIVKRILKNKSFIAALKNYQPLKLHTRLIKFFSKISFDAATIKIFKLWSEKLV